MKFPSADGYRYPSQIFESILDILVLPIVLLVYRRRPPDGVVAWTWFTLYGVTRSLAEIWRQTDLAVGPFTGGQLLALPMIAIGIFMIVRCVSPQRSHGGQSRRFLEATRRNEARCRGGGGRSRRAGAADRRIASAHLETSQRSAGRDGASVIIVGVTKGQPRAHRRFERSPPA